MANPNYTTNPDRDDKGNVASIASISPAKGSVSGGDTVTIKGSKFTDATKVMFGTVAGTNLKVNNDSELTVTAPAQAASTVDVTLEGSKSDHNPSHRFTYA